MSSVRSKPCHRLLSAFLALVMAVSMIPFTAVATAATLEHPDAVTICVKDEKNRPVQGAAVDVTIISQKNGSTQKQLTTDDTGCVEVLPAEEFVKGELSISAEIRKEGYKTDRTTIQNTKITSKNQNLEVVLKPSGVTPPDLPLIEDVTIEGKSSVYNGSKQTLVSVTKVKGDTVTYAIDGGKPSREKPVRRDVCTHQITVTVRRAGHQDLVRTVEGSIVPADITGINMVGKNVTYDGREQQIITVQGTFARKDVVTWTVDKDGAGMPETTVSHQPPKVREVGTYTVTMELDRGANYKKLVLGPVTAKVQEGTLELKDLTVQGFAGVYTVENGAAKAYPAVSVENPRGYHLQYQLDDGDERQDPAAWVEEIPTVTNAGSYLIWVRAVQEGYQDTEVPVIPAQGAQPPYNVVIAPAQQSLQFNDPAYTDGGNSEVTVDKVAPFEETYDFSAKGDNAVGGQVSYALELSEEDADIASIDPATGKLTVTHPGKITVVAKVDGNENYAPREIRHTLDVLPGGGGNGTYIGFEHKTVDDYTIGQQKGQAAVNRAIKKVHRDWGEVTYSVVDGDTVGLAVDGKGTVTVSDYAKLITAANAAKGNLVVTIRADKAAVLGSNGKIRYPADFATYPLTVKFFPTPEGKITISKPTGKDGWYVKPAVVTAPKGYLVANVQGNTGDNFAAQVLLQDDGAAERFVCLQDPATGGIAAPISVKIKIDLSAPADLSYEISEQTLIEKIGEKLGFYKPNVNITIKAKDPASGVDHFTWSYIREEGASSDNAENIVNQLQKVDEVVDGVAVAHVTMPREKEEQYRGTFSFTATDVAGTTSAAKSEDYVFVVDTIAPTMTVQYAGKDNYDGAIHSVGNVHYFNGTVDAALTIKEANFDQQDVRITVSKNGEEGIEPTLTWTNRDANTHVGTFSIAGDGEYVVSVAYQDRADNDPIDYRSEVLAIDTEKPEVNIEYIHDGETQKTIFTVKENHFRPQDVTVTGTMQDITGKPLSFTPEQLTELLRQGTWVEGADNTYTFTYDQYVDGIYQLTLNYRDTAGWDADPFVAETFVVDHTAPVGLKIEYAKSPTDEFLENITLGFYRPSVTVRLTAYDTSAGVEFFTWRYTREPNASVINHPASLPKKTVEAHQDPHDPSKFTAEFALTATEAEQYRGYLTAAAEDQFHNRTEEKADKNNIVVVDTCPPTIKPEYTKADRADVDANTYYYNNNIDVALKITEANFDPADVKISVTKDGAPFAHGEVSWTPKDKEDVSVGTFTLKAPADHSGDGAYVITVAYQDRSGNQMQTYVSGTHVIDTTKPAVEVTYQNQTPANVLQDRYGHDRSYFGDTQTAEITIRERNFNAADVDIYLTARDAGGALLDVDALHTKSAWTVGETPDIHRLTITYPGDANYAFDIAYTDLATNEAEDYTPDYFTVDRTAPTQLWVEYSDSVLDTSIDNTGYSFYNGKVTVTLSAEDSVSGVHSFCYNYRNAPGVSNVNAELVDQAIQAGSITYSDDGKQATATFEIPREVLTAENQFHGSVDFTAVNRSNGQSDPHREARRLVVDTLAPVAEISYNEAVNEVGDVAYYNGNINASVTIREANFYAEDVHILVSKDKGPATEVIPTWTDSGHDVHVGTFTLHEDGDYFVTVDHRDKSGNSMATYTSKQMTIDTDIKEPTYSINGVARTEIGGAYKNDVSVAFQFEDQNFDTKTITLTRTRFNAVEDVTAQFIQVAETEKGGSGSFTIPPVVENDGIYVLHVSMTDRAKHTAESQIKFTVNRFGSVYAYDGTLAALIRDGGQYVTGVKEDLVITEYNASPLLRDSLSILITRDGTPIDVDFLSNPATIDEQVSVGESGWYQYVYRIKASNFAEDGVYKISLASKYAADDSGENDSTSVPENSMDPSGHPILDTMTFTVDSKAPEIRNVVNLEKPIVNAHTLDVKYTVVDVGGLQSIDVIVNGETVETITDFGENLFSYTGQFTMSEKFEAQTVQLRATDRAGNVTDTASEDFHTGDLYVFHDKVTISTNAFVRWYANKPLFWGSIGGVVVLAGAVWLFLAGKRKKKTEEQ